MRKIIEIGIEISERDADGLLMAHVRHIDTRSPCFTATAREPEEAVARLLDMIANDLRDRLAFRTTSGAAIR